MELFDVLRVLPLHSIFPVYKLRTGIISKSYTHYLLIKRKYTLTPLQQKIARFGERCARPTGAGNVRKRNAISSAHTAIANQSLQGFKELLALVLELHDHEQPER